MYRFSNPGAAAVCFNFTLTYGGVVVSEPDAGDAGSTDAGSGTPDAGDAGSAAPPVAGAQRYMTAYGTFFPTDITREYLADVGAVLSAPQSMGVTVPAGDSIDVVVYAIDPAPGGTGAYTLSCATQ